MPKRIQIAPHLAPHLSVDELEQHYRQDKEGVASRHYQIIWLPGKRDKEVAEVTRYRRSRIHEMDSERNQSVWKSNFRTAR